MNEPAITSSWRRPLLVIWCEGTYLRKCKRALVVLRDARGSIAEEYEREGYIFSVYKYSVDGRRLLSKFQNHVL